MKNFDVLFAKNQLRFRNNFHIIQVFIYFIKKVDYFLSFKKLLLPLRPENIFYENL